MPAWVRDVGALPAAVLFDMDGLLVDTEPLWFAAESTVMARMGVTMTTRDHAEFVGGPMSRVVEHMIDRAAGEHDPVEVARSLKVEMEALLAAGPIAWMPGARDLVRALADADVPRALVSSSGRALMRHVLAAINDDVGPAAFEVTLAGDEVERTKPHPDPYLRAAALLGVDPADCVVLEDSHTGISAGLAAGCVVIAVPSVVPPAEPSAVPSAGSIRPAVPSVVPSARSIRPADRLHVRTSLEGLAPESLPAHFSP